MVEIQSDKGLAEAIAVAACQNAVNVVNDVDFFSSGNLTMLLLLLLQYSARNEAKEEKEKKFKEKEHECNFFLKSRDSCFSVGKKSHPKQLLVIAAAAIKIDPLRSLPLPCADISN
jgi:hypothetical protein